MSKLLSVLLTLVLLLSLAGPLAPSARAEGTYKVGLADSFNGKVTADKAMADEGETVRLTVTPSAGYIIESVSVYAIDLHSAVPLTYSEGNYVFTMPASEVQASATFRPAAPSTTEIPSVGLALTLPAAGGSYSDGVPAAVSISSGTGFTVKSANWFNGGTPETNPGCGLAPTSFEPGKPYYAEIFLAPAEGYAFADGTAVTIDTLGVKSNRVIDNEVDRMGWLSIVTNDYTIPAATGYIFKGVSFELAGLNQLTSGSDAGRWMPAFPIDWTKFLVSIDPGADSAIPDSTLVEAHFDFLYTDAACTTILTGDMQDTGTYYLRLVVNNKNAEDHSIDYSSLAAENCSASVAGYTASFVSASATTFAGKDAVEVVFSVTGNSAPAVTEYPVWVGDTQVTSANKDDILGDGGKAKYDPESNTLTLDNPSITTSHGGNAICTESGSLTIKGTATLSASVFSRANLTLIDANLTCTRISSYNTTTIESGTINVISGGIACYHGRLKISGGEITVTSIDGYGVNAPVKISGGTVDITGKTSGIYTSNSADNNAVDITGGTVTVTGTGENGIYSPSGGVTISGGSVTATGGENGIRSEKYDGQILISGGTVKATGTSGDGISGTCPIDITGGTVEATGGSAGIWTNRSITIGNSITKVTADGATNAIRGFDILLGDALIIQEPAGGTIGYMGGGNIVLNGENAATHAVIVPGTAVTTYPVWVGDTHVTSANKDDILGDGGKAKYDPDTNTLTLDNPTISGAYHNAAVYAEVDLTITGSATLSKPILVNEKDLTLDANIVIATPGWDCAIIAGNITVNGGSISASADEDALIAGSSITINDGSVVGNGCDLYAGSITIAGGTVNVSDGLFGIYSKNDITISGGTVTAKGNDYGISARGDVTISGGTVTATGTDVNGSGINGAKVNISGGTVTAKGGDCGIYGKDAVEIENGITSVTADGDTEAINCYNGVITIGDALMIQEPAGGKLSSDGKVIQNADDMDAAHALIVPKEAEKFPVEVVITTQDKDGNVISTVGGTATADKTAVARGETITVTVTPNAGFELESVEFSDGVTGGYQAGTETSSIVPDGFTTSTGKLQIDVFFKETVTPPTPGSWTVTFEANGGTPVPEAQTVADGEKATKPADPTKPGVGFGGWYTDEFFTEAFDFNTPITGNITLYAKWNQYVYVLQIVKVWEDDDDAAGKRPDSVDVEILANGAEVSIVTVKKDEDWKTSFLYASGEADLVLTCEEIVPEGYTLKDMSRTGNTVTLTNQYIGASPVPTTYTVTFETNGGSAVASQTVNSGEKATKPADPTKSGFVFDGWYQDATFATAFDFDVAITADVTVYAKWKEEAAPGEIVYTVVSGGNSTWTKGSSSGVTIVVKRNVDDDTCFSHFTSVQIGSTTLVSGTDYTAVAGSTVITLKPAALEKLSTGTKTVTINFDDGKATTNLTIKAGTSGPGTGTSPKTGDDSNPGLWITVMVLSGFGLGGLALTEKKRRYTSKH